jgi:hypothetical protein
MARRSRRIQPALDELDKKTLLSVGQLGNLVGASPGTALVRDAKHYFYAITITTSGFVAKDLRWSLVILDLNAQKQIVEKTLEEGRTGDVHPNQLKRIEAAKTTSLGNLGVFDFRYKVDGKPVHSLVQAEMSTERRGGFEGPVSVYFLPSVSIDARDA